jgi:hypothetical protein
LDLTTEPTTWKSAVQTAVMEIRRLGLFGLTESELVRYKQAIISEAEHSEAQADHTTNEDVLAELMEAQACGHVYMHPSQRLQATADALDSIILEDVNKVTKGTQIGETSNLHPFYQPKRHRKHTERDRFTATHE